MRYLIYLLAALLVTTALAGCSGDKDRGINRNQDKPQEAPNKGQP
jgi:hypothetical protein